MRNQKQDHSKYDCNVINIISSISTKKIIDMKGRFQSVCILN